MHGHKITKNQRLSTTVIVRKLALYYTKQNNTFQTPSSATIYQHPCRGYPTCILIELNSIIYQAWQLNLIIRLYRLLQQRSITGVFTSSYVLSLT